MKLNTPWLYSKDELRSSLLFHGSCEPWRTAEPRGGGYDGVFWTTEDPLTAQTYIPDWGWKIITGMSRWDLDQRVRPNRNCPLWSIAMTLGATAEVFEYDLDRASSWREGGNPITYRDVANRLEELGYANVDDEYRYRLKIEGSEVLPDSRTPLGRLIIVEPPEAMTCFDMAKGVDHDLMDPQYHHIRAFKDAFAAGFEAVVINDFAQSPKMGNIGHLAIGLAPETASRLHREGRIISIPATHRDFTWPMGRYPNDFSTPDFDHWHFTEVCRAVARGDAVPSHVLADHETRFNDLRNSPLDEILIIPCGIDSLEIPNDWRPSGGSPEREEAIHQTLRCAAAIEAQPIHRRADGTVDLEHLDPDLGGALRRSGLAACIASTLDDGCGNPVSKAKFTARVDELLQAREFELACCTAP